MTGWHILFQGYINITISNIIIGRTDPANTKFQTAPKYPIRLSANFYEPDSNAEIMYVHFASQFVPWSDTFKSG